MSGSDLIALLFGGLMVAAAWWQMPKRWRGEHARSDLNAGKLFLPGMASRRGFRRSIPLATAGFTLGYAAAAAGWIVGVDNLNGLALSVCVGLGVLGLVLIAMMIPVVLFNSPKAAVPPPFRSEPGLIAEWVHRKGTAPMRSGPDERTEP